MKMPRITMVAAAMAKTQKTFAFRLSRLAPSSHASPFPQQINSRPTKQKNLLPFSSPAKSFVSTCIENHTTKAVNTKNLLSKFPRNNSCRFMTSSNASSSDVQQIVQQGISRVETLQKMLAKCGAPGSKFCDKENDLEACDPGTFIPDMHPLLIPLMKSKTTGKYICAYNRSSPTEEGRTAEPMPIVESGENMPGMRLLSLNSEHLMRRIACEADGNDNLQASEIIEMYNEGVGEGDLPTALDSEYEAGSVAKLGYGPEKYILLRVAPFSDLYETMALQHLERGDDKSALIAAEANNGKFVGFGSTFLFYARLYSKLENRSDEARDAARVCLRLPLSTTALTADELKELAVLGQVAEEEDSYEESMAKLQKFMKAQEAASQKPGADQSGKTQEQLQLEEADALLDGVAMSVDGKPKWSTTRKRLGEIYSLVGKDAMAKFVDPSRSN